MNNEDFLGDHRSDEDQWAAAEEQTSQGHDRADTQDGCALASDRPDSRAHLDAHNAYAAGATNFLNGQTGSDPHRGIAVEDTAPQAGADAMTTPTCTSPGLADPLLALLADVLDDLERTRIANENRLRQLTRGEADADGQTRGLGLPADMPQVAAVAAIVDGIGRLEHEAELNLKRALRQHPLGPWIKAQKGVGEKQAARLLAAIGDPYYNDLHGRPRTVGELWAYCGLHVLPVGHMPGAPQRGVAGGDLNFRTGQKSGDSHASSAGPELYRPSGQSSCEHRDAPAAGAPDTHLGYLACDTQRAAAEVGQAGSDPNPRSDGTHVGVVGVAPSRARGQRANWSATAKMRAFLIAEACIKQLGAECKQLGENQHVEGCSCGGYRKVYDAGRIKYADALHPVDCKRCGPAGKPAPVGTPLSLGHQHARALRLVMKAVLRDLWIEARAIHEADTKAA